MVAKILQKSKLKQYEEKFQEWVNVLYLIFLFYYLIISYSTKKEVKC